MSIELKRNKCLENIAYVIYRSNPNLENCGRYIKALRNSLSLTTDIEEKRYYEELIKKCLSNHIIHLQEALLGASELKENNVIPFDMALRIKSLSRSNNSLSEGKYSLVNIDALKKMLTIKKAVVLEDSLVLPCKVKSFDQKYKFNTQIIMSKDNVLAYTNDHYELDTSLINHYTLINKIGSGILNSELLKSKKQEVR